MPSNTHTSTGHPTSLEQHLAVAVVLWMMLAGVCVLIANAWAMEMMV